jgi:transposase
MLSVVGEVVRVYVLPGWLETKVIQVESLRNYLRRRGIRFTIPRLSNEPRRGPFSREIYRQRNIVERAINRLKQFRRIATRYEKLAANYTAMLTIACIFLWL